jgi:hypothetical protein
MTTQDWNLDAGLVWRRIIPIKDRRTRRILRPTDVAGAIKTNEFGGLLPFTCYVTAEGAVLIELSAEETRSLADGVYDYDVVATIPMSSPVERFESRKVLSGKITVTNYTTITYGDEDVTNMELRFTRGEDFTRPIAWRDEDAALIAVQKAYLQATMADLTTVVLDLRWFASVPNEATIAALPATQRGYIVSGAPDNTIVIHVSNTHTIPAGVYPWTLFVQDIGGDWQQLLKGSLYVDAAPGANPYP